MKVVLNKLVVYWHCDLRPTIGPKWLFCCVVIACAESLAMIPVYCQIDQDEKQVNRISQSVSLSLSLSLSHCVCVCSFFIRFLLLIFGINNKDWFQWLLVLGSVMGWCCVIISVSLILFCCLYWKLFTRASQSIAFAFRCSLDICTFLKPTALKNQEELLHTGISQRHILSSSCWSFLHRYEFVLMGCAFAYYLESVAQYEVNLSPAQLCPSQGSG